MRPAPIFAVSVDEFGSSTGCDIASVPRNVVLVGYRRAQRMWLVAPSAHATGENFDTRVPITLRWLDQALHGRDASTSFWFPLCFWDGWRERVPPSDSYRRVAVGRLGDVDEWRGAPGELPAWSRLRDWVACYAAHRGDPSAELLPEPYWLMRGGYTGLFAEVRAATPPWDAREPRAIYRGGDHGEVANLYAPPPTPGMHPRRLLQAAVEAAGWPVDVRLGSGASLRDQLACRWILDVDGMVRTFDAFAWKMASGSLVLVPDSPWETFFTRAFSPWEHYVPVANDFSDLGERLAWCRDHDDACRAIAEAAAKRASEVYDPARVAREVATHLRARLAEPPPR